MPELPEVETLRIQLSQLIVGLVIKDIDILNPKSFAGDKKLVFGKKIIGVRRFAKILIVDLENGLSLAIHLKMSGQLIYKIKNTNKKSKIDILLLNLPNKHTRVIINFTNGNRLFFNDMRIFGWMKIVESQNSKFKSQNFKSKFKIIKLEELIHNLGPEPMRDLTIGKFNETVKGTSRPIKLVLMDQEKISGVGNIYANDALFLAGIHPATKTNILSNSQMVKLFNSLIRVLRDGIKWKGASKNHFRDIYGRKGQVQEHFYVYDKEGKECMNHCGGKIKRIKLGGRGTFYCPMCQK